MRVDHDGRTRKWVDSAAVDEAFSTVHCNGVLLPRRLRTRLRIYNACTRHGALRLLGKHVSLSPVVTMCLPLQKLILCYSAFTRPDVPKVAYPEGFQGNSIPIDGALVARLCHERITLSEEADD